MWTRRGERKLLRQVCTMTIVLFLKPWDMSCRCHFLCSYNFQDKIKLQGNLSTNLTIWRKKTAHFAYSSTKKLCVKHFRHWSLIRPKILQFLELGLFCHLGLFGQQFVVGSAWKLRFLRNSLFYSLRPRNVDLLYRICYAFLRSNPVPSKVRTSRMYSVSMMFIEATEKCFELTILALKRQRNEN